MLFYNMYVQTHSHKPSGKIGRWFQTFCFGGEEIYICSDEKLKKKIYEMITNWQFKEEVFPRTAGWSSAVPNCRTRDDARVPKDDWKKSSGEV